MLDGLQTEIDNHSSLTGASDKIKMNYLNKDGSANTEAWVTSEDSCRLKKITFLSMLSNANIDNLITFLGANAALKLLFDSGDTFDASHPKFIEMINLLATNTVISASEQTTALRVGQRSKSRAEELFSRKLTEGDF